MGGRGAGIGKVAIKKYEKQIKSLQKQYDKIVENKIDMRSDLIEKNIYVMPPEYYKLHKKANDIRDKINKLDEKRIKLVRIEEAKNPPKPEHHTFVNAWGEATRREITSLSYKRAVKRTQKELKGHHVY